MTFTTSRHGLVELPPDSVEYMRRFRQPPGSPETGGAIGGYFRKDRTLVISHVMPPSPRNQAGPSWLKRHRGDAQKFVNQIFAESQGYANYLGEWHTHSEPNPSPSDRDKKMMNDLLTNSTLEIDFLVGVIVGNTGNLCVWVQDLISGSEVLP